MIDLKDVGIAIILHGMIDVGNWGTGAWAEHYIFQLERGRLEIDFYGTLVYSETTYLHDSIMEDGKVIDMPVELRMSYYEGDEEVNIDPEDEDRIGTLFMDQVFFE